MRRIEALMQPILRVYDKEELLSYKKALYTMVFLGLIAIYSVVVVATDILTKGFKISEIIEMAVWGAVIPGVAYIISKGKLTLAINLFALVGIWKGFDLINMPVGLHFYMHFSLVVLVISAIHNKKYQLHSVLSISYLAIVYRAIFYSMDNFYTVEGVLLNYRISIIVGFLMYLITVLYLSNIMDREIYKSRQLAKLTRTDALTQLPNRYAFNEYVESMSGDISYGLMVLDLDHFKQVNDQFGHDKGDQILMRFAGVLSNNLRSTDEIFRLGGEEFCVIVKNITPEIGRRIAEALRLTTEKYPFGIGMQITVSIGITHMNVGWDVDEFMDYFVLADQALYEAKESGRNKIVTQKLVD